MSRGGLIVRPGDVDADRRLALEMFARYLNPLYDGARFDWVYRLNPHGLGKFWVATDPGNGTVVGIAGAFPRRVSVSGRPEVGWVLGDFCIAQAYRTIGPAVTLQRACFGEVTAGGVPFCYDFPSAGMMAVYRRLGIKPLGQMVRLVRPLRVEARLRALIGRQTLTRPLGALASLFLAPRGRRKAGVPGLEITLRSEPFDDEFTAFYRRYAEGRALTIERSAEYLNWRYLANPLHRHEVMTARQARRLAGYAVFGQDDDVMTLVDVFTGGGGETFAELIRRLVVLSWQRGLEATSMTLLESSPWIQDLKRAGFKERETNPVIVYASPKASPEVGDERAWHLLQGDRDS
jgi:hypothetical protein